MNCIQDCVYFTIRGILDVSLMIYFFLLNCVFFVKYCKTRTTALNEILLAERNTDTLYKLVNKIKNTNTRGNWIEITSPKNTAFIMGDYELKTMNNTKFLIESHDSEIRMLVSWIGMEGELKIYENINMNQPVEYKWKGKIPKIICTTSILNNKGEIVHNKRLGYHKNIGCTKNFESIIGFLNEVSDFALYLRYFRDYTDSKDD